MNTFIKNNLKKEFKEAGITAANIRKKGSISCAIHGAEMEITYSRGSNCYTCIIKKEVVTFKKFYDMLDTIIENVIKDNKNEVDNNTENEVDNNTENEVDNTENEVVKFSDFEVDLSQFVKDCDVYVNIYRYECLTDLQQFYNQRRNQNKRSAHLNTIKRGLEKVKDGLEDILIGLTRTGKISVVELEKVFYEYTKYVNNITIYEKNYGEVIEIFRIQPIIDSLEV